MLNVVVIDNKGEYTEHEWSSMEAFVSDMDDGKENTPSLDDVLVEVETDNENLHLWWRNTDGLTVDDLYEECRQELCMDEKPTGKPLKKSDNDLTL